MTSEPPMCRPQTALIQEDIQSIDSEESIPTTVGYAGLDAWQCTASDPVWQQIQSSWAELTTNAQTPGKSYNGVNQRFLQGIPGAGRDRRSERIRSFLKQRQKTIEANSAPQAIPLFGGVRDHDSCW
jgi:hypothetical protein